MPKASFRMASVSREPVTRAATSRRITPAHLPRAAVMTHAHAYPATLPSGRTEWTYCHLAAVRPCPDGNHVAPKTQKAPSHRALSVRPRGLEPPREFSPTRPSTLRVYQFRHRRVAGGV